MFSIGWKRPCKQGSGPSFIVDQSSSLSSVTPSAGSWFVVDMSCVVVLYSVCVFISTSCIAFVYMFDTDVSLYIICCIFSRSSVLYKLYIIQLAVGSLWLFCWFKTQISSRGTETGHFLFFLTPNNWSINSHVAWSASRAWRNWDIWNGLNKTNVFCLVSKPVAFHSGSNWFKSCFSFSETLDHF